MIRELDKLAPRINVPIRLIIIGGVGLINFGLKEATKDVDVVIKSSEELQAFIHALENLGYRSKDLSVISRPYKKMKTSRILENSEGFRWDIFLNQVCRALVLSSGMESRTTPFYDKGLLTAKLASKEDLFLFKGITEREADLDDMRLSAESGLNWRLIEQECQNQSASSGRLWENALLENLVDLKERHKIRSPIEGSLRKVVEEKLIEDALISAIAKGCVAVSMISKATELPGNLVRKYTNRMEEKGVLKVDRSGHPHRFTLVASPKSK